MNDEQPFEVPGDEWTFRGDAPDVVAEKTVESGNCRAEWTVTPNPDGAGYTAELDVTSGPSSAEGRATAGTPVEAMQKATEATRHRLEGMAELLADTSSALADAAHWPPDADLEALAPAERLREAVRALGPEAVRPIAYSVRSPFALAQQHLGDSPWWGVFTKSIAEIAGHRGMEPVWQILAEEIGEKGG